MLYWYIYKNAVCLRRKLNMAIPCSEFVLKQSLTKKKLDKYSVIDFCKDAGINRGLFYSQYRNLSDLFVSVLTLRLKKSMRNTKNESINRVFYRLLCKIKKDAVFYLNILHISKKHETFYPILKKEIAIGLENYMRPRGAFSVRTIELVAEGIYSVLFNWISHEYQTDIRDIYQCINLFLPQIEKDAKK